MGGVVSRDRRFPVGSRVRLQLNPFTAEEPVSAKDIVDAVVTVIKHGRDERGIYTRVRFDDGREDNYHRSYLRPPHDREDCPCGHPAGTLGACGGCNCADDDGST